jgi:hypothetical protein
MLLFANLWLPSLALQMGAIQRPRKHFYLILEFKLTPASLSSQNIRRVRLYLILPRLEARVLSQQDRLTTQTLIDTSVTQRQSASHEVLLHVRFTRLCPVTKHMNDDTENS